MMSSSSGCWAHLDCLSVASAKTSVRKLDIEAVEPRAALDLGLDVRACAAGAACAGARGAHDDARVSHPADRLPKGSRSWASGSEPRDGAGIGARPAISSLSTYQMASALGGQPGTKTSTPTTPWMGLTTDSKAGTPLRRDLRLDRDGVAVGAIDHIGSLKWLRMAGTFPLTAQSPRLTRILQCLRNPVPFPGRPPS
jgi:hypothetical protein